MVLLRDDDVSDEKNPTERLNDRGNRLITTANAAPHPILVCRAWFSPRRARDWSKVTRLSQWLRESRAILDRLSREAGRVCVTESR